jgi:hypothetical protein
MLRAQPTESLFRPVPPGIDRIANILHISNIAQRRARFPSESRRQRKVGKGERVRADTTANNRLYGDNGRTKQTGPAVARIASA